MKKRSSVVKRRKNANSYKNRNTKWIIRYNGPTFMASEFFTKHTFTQTDRKLTGLAPTIAFSLNILNLATCDPSDAQNGVSGLDEMNQLYDKWRVNYAVLDIRFWNSETDENFEVIVRPRAGEVLPTMIQEEREQPYVKYGVMGVQGSSRANLRLVSAINPNALSRRKLVFDDDALTNGTQTTGPIENYRWGIMISNLEGNNVVNMLVMTKITYYVRWYDKILVSPS